MTVSNPKCKVSAFMRVTAIITLCAFIYSFVIYEPLRASVEFAQDQHSVKEIKDKLENFVLPYRYGRIMGGYGADTNRLVVYIQDLHCNPEVQKNIYEIINVISNRYGVNKIYMEGAPKGKVDASLLNVIPEETRNKVFENLLCKGLIGGAEYYGITKAQDKLYGLEDWNVYKANLLRIQKLLENKEENKSISENLNQSLRKIQSKYLSENIWKLEKTLNDASNQKRYLKYEKLGNKYGENVNSYPNLARYIKLLRLKNSISFKRIPEELQRFVGELKTIVPFGVYQALVSKLEDPNREEEYYFGLSEVAKKYAPDINKKYPDVSQFLEYITLNYQINPVYLVAEESSFVERVISKKADNETDKEVIFLSGMIKKFNNLAELKLTPGEFSYFKENKNWFRALIQKYIPASELTQAIKLLDNEEIYSFFETNLSRNDIFVKNITDSERSEESRCLNNHGVDSVLSHLSEFKTIDIVVAGGFHAEVTGALKKRNISYLAITPNASNKFDANLYDRVITGRLKTTDILNSALSPEGISVAIEKLNQHGIARGNPAELSNLVLLLQKINEEFSREGAQNSSEMTNEIADKLQKGVKIKTDPDGKFEALVIPSKDFKDNVTITVRNDEAIFEHSKASKKTGIKLLDGSSILTVVATVMEYFAHNPKVALVLFIAGITTLIYRFKKLYKDNKVLRHKVRLREATISEKNKSLRSKDEQIAELNEKIKLQEAENNRLKQIAEKDGLTGLYRKEVFYSQLALEISQADRRSDGKTVSVLFIDADHFKSINDTYGHDAGDYVLKSIAKVLNGNNPNANGLVSALRQSDMSFRYGGEEFVVILPETDKQGAEKTAERIRKAVENLELMYKDKTMRITISIGLSIYNDENDISGDVDNRIRDSGELILRADAALYNAKHSGRNRISHANKKDITDLGSNIGIIQIAEGAVNATKSITPKAIAAGAVEIFTGINDMPAHMRGRFAVIAYTSQNESDLEPIARALAAKGVWPVAVKFDGSLQEGAKLGAKLPLKMKEASYTADIYYNWIPLKGVPGIKMLKLNIDPDMGNMSQVTKYNTNLSAVIDILSREEKDPIKMELLGKNVSDSGIKFGSCITGINIGKNEQLLKGSIVAFDMNKLPSPASDIDLKKDINPFIAVLEEKSKTYYVGEESKEEKRHNELNITRGVTVFADATKEQAIEFIRKINDSNEITEVYFGLNDSDAGVLTEEAIKSSSKQAGRYFNVDKSADYQNALNSIIKSWKEGIHTKIDITWDNKAGAEEFINKLKQAQKKEKINSKVIIRVGVPMNMMAKILNMGFKADVVTDNHFDASKIAWDGGTPQITVYGEKDSDTDNKFIESYSTIVKESKADELVYYFKKMDNTNALLDKLINHFIDALSQTDAETPSVNFKSGREFVRRNMNAEEMGIAAHSLLSAQEGKSTAKELLDIVESGDVSASAINKISALMGKINSPLMLKVGINRSVETIEQADNEKDKKLALFKIKGIIYQSLAGAFYNKAVENVKDASLLKGMRNDIEEMIFKQAAGLCYVNSSLQVMKDESIDDMITLLPGRLSLLNDADKESLAGYVVEQAKKGSILTQFKLVDALYKGGMENQLVDLAKSIIVPETLTAEEKVYLINLVTIFHKMKIDINFEPEDPGSINLSEPSLSMLALSLSMGRILKAEQLTEIGVDLSRIRQVINSKEIDNPQALLAMQTLLIKSSLTPEKVDIQLGALSRDIKTYDSGPLSAAWQLMLERLAIRKQLEITNDDLKRIKAIETRHFISVFTAG